tara:strand:- start:354 stop:572 length:219 start_codon:yes stop_codon:yes gene_type:complete
VPQGTVTRLFSQRGFGYITPDDSDRDVLVTMDVIPTTMNALVEGQRVEFETIEIESGVKASSLHLLAESVAI